MLRLIGIIYSLFFLILTTTAALADDEASNRAYVTASEYGQFYAKSVPHESYGLKGITSIYRVSEGEDILLQTYDWYSPRLFLEGFGDTVYVVQMGPWHRGRSANATDHAVAFYKNDKLLKKHSTLDVVGIEDNVSNSESHYRVFSGEPRFRRPFGDKLFFDIKTHNGKPLLFNTETGFLIGKEEKAFKKHLYEAEMKISQMKWQWYGKNQETIPGITELLITEELLRKISPGDFPSLPEGYRYTPDTIHSPVRIERAGKKD